MVTIPGHSVEIPDPAAASIAPSNTDSDAQETSGTKLVPSMLRSDKGSASFANSHGRKIVKPIRLVMTLMTKACSLLSEASIATLAYALRWRRLQSLRTLLKNTQHDVDYCIPRDIGAAALADPDAVKAHEAVAQEVVAAQKRFDVANQAGLAGDRKKQKEAKELAREVVALQTQYGHAILDAGDSIPCLAELCGQHNEKKAQIASCQAEITDLRHQMNGSATSKYIALTGATGLLAALLFVTILILASVFGPKAYITAAKDEKGLEKTLGMVVSGCQVTDAKGEMFEVPFGMGSAFAVSRQGYMLTNRHVIEKIHMMSIGSEWKRDFWENGWDADVALWVFVEGQKVPARIVSISEDYDIAILKADHDFSLYFRLSQDPKVQRDTEVRAVGFPAAASVAVSEHEKAIQSLREYSQIQDVSKYFKQRDFEFTLTSGRISRCAEEEGSSAVWVQHNADINPGNSGGPLLTEDGVVVGINTMGHQSASGVHFALGVPQLREFLEEYIDDLVWE